MLPASWAWGIPLGLGIPIPIMGTGAAPVSQPGGEKQQNSAITAVFPSHSSFPQGRALPWPHVSLLLLGAVALRKAPAGPGLPCRRHWGTQPFSYTHCGSPLPPYREASSFLTYDQAV